MHVWSSEMDNRATYSACCGIRLDVVTHSAARKHEKEVE